MKISLRESSNWNKILNDRKMGNKIFLLSSNLPFLKRNKRWISKLTLFRQNSMFKISSSKNHLPLNYPKHQLWHQNQTNSSTNNQKKKEMKRIWIWQLQRLYLMENTHNNKLYLRPIVEKTFRSQIDVIFKKI